MEGRAFTWAEPRHECFFLYSFLHSVGVVVNPKNFMAVVFLMTSNAYIKSLFMLSCSPTL